MRDSLKRYYSEIRQRNLEAAQQRQSECEAKNPRLKALREERGQVLCSFAAGKLTSDQAHSRIGAISAERKNLLIGMGYPASYLDPVYSCSKCKDTGEIGDGVKRLCSCALKQMQKELSDGAGINSEETFAHFDPSVYLNSDEQRRRALSYKRYFETFAEKLPNPDKPNILMVGDAGTGKSFFGNAIAYAAIERGIETMRLTAYRLIEDALDGIGGDSAALKHDINVPLLILDDLGTEPMIPNVTLETVYRVINERITRKLPTVIITNLASEALSERYGERITSRIVDRDTTGIAVFRGINLRTRQN